MLEYVQDFLLKSHRELWVFWGDKGHKIDNFIISRWDCLKDQEWWVCSNCRDFWLVLNRWFYYFQCKVPSNYAIKGNFQKYQSSYLQEKVVTNCAKSKYFKFWWFYFFPITFFSNKPIHQAFLFWRWDCFPNWVLLTICKSQCIIFWWLSLILSLFVED